MARCRAMGVKSPRRCGMAVVVLLALLTISLALSYAMLRTQFAVAQMDGTRMRMTDARQAALAGMAAGLRQMHQNSWGGVATTYNRLLGPNARFEVSYQAGDASLAPGDPDYALYPYRVTVTSTGYAQDPANANATSSYQVQTVVQLVPRALSTQPSGWSVTQGFTLMQWHLPGGQEFIVEVPCRIEGNVHVQTALTLAEDYPGWAQARTRLFSDWNQMRLNGLPDYRPFNGTVHMAYLLNSLSTRLLLTNSLGVTTQNTWPHLIPFWQRPSGNSTYQIYPGGPRYTMQELPSRLRDRTLTPDPVLNPLGVYQATGELELERNVSIEGTLIVNRSGGQSGDLVLDGRNVSAAPVDLLPLDGTSQKVQLPTMVVRDDLLAENGSHTNLRGLITVDGRFAVEDAPQSATRFQLDGRLLAEHVAFEARNEWDKPSSWWETQLNSFLADLQSQPNPIQYFGAWLEARRGLINAPQITLQPDAAGPTYQWLTSTQPIYVAGAQDGGLRWEVIRWTAQ